MQWAEFDRLVEALDLPRRFSSTPTFSMVAGADGTSTTPVGHTTSASAQEKEKERTSGQGVKNAGEKETAAGAAAVAKVVSEPVVSHAPPSTPGAATAAAMADLCSPPSSIRMPPPPCPPPLRPTATQAISFASAASLTPAAQFGSSGSQSQHSLRSSKDESQSPSSQTESDSQYESEGSQLFYTQGNQLACSYEESPERPMGISTLDKNCRNGLRSSTGSRASGGGKGWLVTVREEERLLSLRTSALGKLGIAQPTPFSTTSSSNSRNQNNLNLDTGYFLESVSYAAGAKNNLRTATREFALHVWQIHKQRSGYKNKDPAAALTGDVLAKDLLSSAKYGIATSFLRNFSQQQLGDMGDDM